MNNHYQKVFDKPPVEFAGEAQKQFGVSLDGSFG
jgi:hypothetical protein